MAFSHDKYLNCQFKMKKKNLLTNKEVKTETWPILPPTLFFFVNAIEKVLRICTVMIFLSDSFEDMNINREFELSSDGGGGGWLYVPITVSHQN